MHGEAGDVDIQSAEVEMEKQYNLLKPFNVHNVYNMDELGLYFRTIPCHSYLLPNETDKRQYGRESKAMKAKERVTVLLCANALGSCKLPPLVIGSSKKPRCFKNTPPCLPYVSQANAWNNQATYRKWFFYIFLPAVRIQTSDRVALVIDGFSGHDLTCADPLNQAEVFKLPPNVTSIYQPMDQGIIAALKVRYRSTLLAKCAQVHVAENFSTLQSLAQHLPQGSAGLDYGCPPPPPPPPPPPHIGDSVGTLKETWDKISPAIIAGC